MVGVPRPLRVRDSLPGVRGLHALALRLPQGVRQDGRPGNDEEGIMTDRYVFNPDIHEDWTPPAHRCGNWSHHEHEVVEVECIAKDGSEVSEIKAPGAYTVTVEAVGGDYKGGKVSATITVKGASLANATLFQVNPDDAKDVSDTTFTYTGNVLDLGVQVDGKALKAGTDYTIKFVNAGGDANNDPAVEVKNAGKYYAVITGQGNFVGNVKKIANVEVAQFDLASATISVDDVYGATAAKPSTPTSVKNGSDVLANPAEVKLTLNDGQTWDAKGQYAFTAKADGNTNITGSNANVTCSKVDAVATFEYDGAAFPTEFTSNKGDKKPVYFDLDKIAAKDAAGKAVDESLIDVTVTDKDGNDATADFEAHKAGTYTVKAAINDDTYTLGGSAE